MAPDAENEDMEDSNDSEIQNLDENTELEVETVKTETGHVLDSDVSENIEENEISEDSEIQREIRYKPNVYEWRTRSCPDKCKCTINDLRQRFLFLKAENSIFRFRNEPKFVIEGHRDRKMYFSFVI